jgi:hypothetical protein
VIFAFILDPVPEPDLDPVQTKNGTKGKKNQN